MDSRHVVAVAIAWLICCYGGCGTFAASATRTSPYGQQRAVYEGFHIWVPMSYSASASICRLSKALRGVVSAVERNSSIAGKSRDAVVKAFELARLNSTESSVVDGGRNVSLEISTTMRDKAQKINTTSSQMSAVANETAHLLVDLVRSFFEFGRTGDCVTLKTHHTFCLADESGEKGATAVPDDCRVGNDTISAAAELSGALASAPRNQYSLLLDKRQDCELTYMYPPWRSLAFLGDKNFKKYSECSSFEKRVSRALRANVTLGQYDATAEWAGLWSVVPYFDKEGHNKWLPNITWIGEAKMNSVVTGAFMIQNDSDEVAAAVNRTVLHLQSVHAALCKAKALFGKAVTYGRALDARITENMTAAMKAMEKAKNTVAESQEKVRRIPGREARMSDSMGLFEALQNYVDGRKSVVESMRAKAAELCARAPGVIKNIEALMNGARDGVRHIEETLAPRENVSFNDSCGTEVAPTAAGAEGAAELFVNVSHAADYANVYNELVRLEANLTELRTNEESTEKISREIIANATRISDAVENEAKEALRKFNQDKSEAICAVRRELVAVLANVSEHVEELLAAEASATINDTTRAMEADMRKIEMCYVHANASVTMAKESARLANETGAEASEVVAQGREADREAHVALNVSVEAAAAYARAEVAVQQLESLKAEAWHLAEAANKAKERLHLAGDKGKKTAEALIEVLREVNRTLERNGAKPDATDGLRAIDVEGPLKACEAKTAASPTSINEFVQTLKHVYPYLDGDTVTAFANATSKLEDEVKSIKASLRAVRTLEQEISHGTHSVQRRAADACEMKRVAAQASREVAQKRAVAVVALQAVLEKCAPLYQQFLDIFVHLRR
ncbi:hypothetical protein, conserved in T. vivax [Trypanosoma vivax Y486]|uniref:Uncharacterized protein n=1 Tax=Trypanosoma vivax (strain Y486) TaxID=1055687 RepID=F9WP07_TRYVY|nr:hypothetical protein, conserved in T. vivax [Trypanosoma vivax Y486]|eukprot:CCD19280.1 hypothetical protein, conserved in T. vivax [Trypanosoma vivax Y486]